MTRKVSTLITGPVNFDLHVRYIFPGQGHSFNRENDGLLPCNVTFCTTLIPYSLSLSILSMLESRFMFTWHWRSLATALSCKHTPPAWSSSDVSVRYYRVIASCFLFCQCPFGGKEGGCSDMSFIVVRKQWNELESSFSRRGFWNFDCIHLKHLQCVNNFIYLTGKRSHGYASSYIRLS
jgi:hypothetical protein